MSLKRIFRTTLSRLTFKGKKKESKGKESMPSSFLVLNPGYHSTYQCQ